MDGEHQAKRGVGVVEKAIEMERVESTNQYLVVTVLNGILIFLSYYY